MSADDLKAQLVELGAVVSYEDRWSEGLGMKLPCVVARIGENTHAAVIRDGEEPALRLLLGAAKP